MINRRLRGVLLILLLVCLHAMAPNVLERWRLALVGTLARPLSVAAPASEDPTPLSKDAEARVAAARIELLTKGKAADPALEPVLALDVDLRRGRLLVAAGRAHGVVRGARVFHQGRCLGIVDAVRERLSLVRLLTGVGTRLAVRVNADDRSLPGGLEQLYGVIQGDGLRARLTGAFLPTAFRVGDLVTTVEEGQKSSRTVGHIAEQGEEPVVELSAQSRGATFVAIEGTHTSSEARPLFDRRLVTTLYRAHGPAFGVVISGEEVAGVPVGSAVHSGGRLLGVVREVFAQSAFVEPPDKSSEEISVLVHRRGSATVAALMLPLGRTGEGRIVRWFGPSVRGEETVVMTAGGQALVPPFLVLGEGTIDDEDRIVLDSGGSAWPDTLTLSVFTEVEARRQLIGDSR